MSDVPVWVWVLIAIALLLLLRRGKKPATTARRRRPRSGGRSGRSTHGIPRERGVLTRYLQEKYRDVENAKRGGRNREWVRSLGQAICDVGLRTEQLSVREKFAAVFLVNQCFHGGYSGAEEKKNYLQRTIILYHRNEVHLKLVPYGEYAGTYEISIGIWMTHLPRRVVENGGLERSGRPSPRAVLDSARRHPWDW